MRTRMSMSKNLLLILVMNICVNSCVEIRNNYDRNYNIISVDDVQTDKTGFSDENISMRIVDAEHFYRVYIENISTQPIEILWDEMRIKMDDTISKVINKAVNLYDVPYTPINSVIKPGEFLQDKVIPAYNVIFKDDVASVIKLNEEEIRSHVLSFVYMKGDEKIRHDFRFGLESIIEREGGKLFFRRPIFYVLSILVAAILAVFFRVYI